MIKTVLYYKIIEENSHPKPSLRSDRCHRLWRFKKPRSVCRPQTAKNWDHFSPRHARGKNTSQAAIPLAEKSKIFRQLYVSFRVQCGCRDVINGAYPPKKSNYGHGQAVLRRRAGRCRARCRRSVFVLARIFALFPPAATPELKRRINNFYGRKIKNHPPGRPQ